MSQSILILVKILFLDRDHNSYYIFFYAIRVKDGTEYANLELTHHYIIELSNNFKIISPPFFDFFNLVLLCLCFELYDFCLSFIFP